MPQLDLRPAADQMARLLKGIQDDALDAPTPCPELRLGDLIDHIGAFAKVFAASATKDIGELTASPPAPQAANLPAGWRAVMAEDLAALADAWDSPAAWEGMTQAGGLDLPAAVAGGVALDELVVHGWDIARSSGQPFECDDSSLREIEATVRQFRGGNEGEIPGLFGPVVPVPDDAPLLNRVLGLTGRDPAWSPSG